MTAIYRRLRANGDIFIAISLSGCLIFRNWAIAALSVYLFLLIASSAFGSIWESIKNYNWKFFQTYAGTYYNVKIISLFPLFFLLMYHDDGLANMETPLKSLLVAYIIVLNVDRFRWSLLVRGAAIGAIAALVFGALQMGYYVAVRSGGATNPIRFGMIAMALSSVCAVGLLYSQNSRSTAVLSLLGFLAGIGAAFMSGSRGALLALPFIFVLLAPVLWMRSKRTFVIVVALVALFTGALLYSDVGKMGTRVSYALFTISEIVTGAEPTDGSVGDRTKLLALAYQLFEEHPLLGVGSDGWAQAIDGLYNAADPDDRIAVPYNQAHNQYADDLAKGGIVRFLLGFVLLFLPLYLFFKCEPYSGQPGSQFALAGVIVSVAFMIFCLSESLMILSLSSVVHAILIFSLLRACDGMPWKSENPAADQPATDGKVESAA